jgi:hypothetical protein
MAPLHLQDDVQVVMEVHEPLQASQGLSLPSPLSAPHSLLNSAVSVPCICVCVQFCLPGWLLLVLWSLSVQLNPCLTVSASGDTKQVFGSKSQKTRYKVVITRQDCLSQQVWGWVVWGWLIQWLRDLSSGQDPGACVSFKVQREPSQEPPVRNPEHLLGWIMSQACARDGPNTQGMRPHWLAGPVKDPALGGKKDPASLQHSASWQGGEKSQSSSKKRGRSGCSLHPSYS